MDANFILLSQRQRLKEELERERKKAVKLEKVRLVPLSMLIDSWTSIPPKMW